MAENYYETDEYIFPFEHVIFVVKCNGNEPAIRVYLAGDSNKWTRLAGGDMVRFLTGYRAWLESQ